MANSKLVTDEEYKFILDKVNRVICQFSNSTDKTSEAVVFLTRVEEKCSSRTEFLQLIDQRLQMLTNTDKSQEYIDWFKARRSSLAAFLQGIKDKLIQDSNYLSKYSPAFTKGVQCLDRLLKLDVESIGHVHMVDLSRVRKAVLEMKSEIDAKSKPPTKIPLDESAVYCLLQDISNAVHALYLQESEPTSSRSSTIDALARLKDRVDAHFVEYKAELHRASLYRAQCTSALLTDLLAQLNKPAVTSANEESEEEQKDTVYTPATSIYAIICDMKSQEWKHLQNKSTHAVDNNRSAASVHTTNAASVEQAAKKRRFPVTVSDVKLSMVLQRRLDGLQAQQNNVEMAVDCERSADFKRQSDENKALLEGFDWASMLDLVTYEGPAAVTSIVTN